MSAIGWAKEHPGLAIGGAIAIVLVVAMATGGSKSDATGGNSQSVAAYYGAVANQAQAGAAIQMKQIEANAGTNQALIAASFGLQKEQIDAASAQNIAGINAGVASKALDIQSKALDVQQLDIQNEWHKYDQGISLADAALRTKSLGAEQRGAVVQAAITQQPVTPTYAGKPSNPGNSASSIIGSIASVVKSVAPFGLF